jgi:hypothetical protein
MDMSLCADCTSFGTSLMYEIVPLYFSAMIFTLTALTLRRVLFGRPRLTLFRIG